MFLSSFSKTIHGKQINKNYTFESDTDTEVIAKLVKHLKETHPELSFRELVEQTTLQLVSSALKKI